MLAKQPVLHLPLSFSKLVAMVALVIGNIRYGAPCKDDTPHRC